MEDSEWRGGRNSDIRDTNTKLGNLTRNYETQDCTKHGLQKEARTTPDTMTLYFFWQHYTCPTN